MKVFEFDRRWSFFDPAYTYNVSYLGPGDFPNRIGSVARHAHDERRWFASNITWHGGGELIRTFRTRREAADALWHIANGTDPEFYGGYHPRRERA